MRNNVQASSLFWLIAIAILIGGSTGCATRISRESVIKRRVAQVDFVREVKGLFQTKAQGFEHPAIISKERLVHILSAVEVETPADGGVFIREPAIHPELVEDAATAISEAFAKAGPDQELGVKLVRKEANLGLFHTKYLTSFLAHIKDGHLYLRLARVNWRIPQAKEDDRLPEPRRDEAPMKFRVVSGDHLFYAGPQALEIAWQDSVFRQAYRLPGSTEGGKRRREVLFQAPIPAEERRAAESGEVSVDQLSSDQLRALADLEDDRRQGKITEAAYQRAKRQLLRER